MRPVIIAFNTSSDTCKFKDHSGGDFGWNRLVFIRRGTRAKDKNLPRTKESLSTKSFASFRFLLSRALPNGNNIKHGIAPKIFVYL